MHPLIHDESDNTKYLEDLNVLDDVRIDTHKY